MGIINKVEENYSFQINILQSICLEISRIRDYFSDRISEHVLEEKSLL